MSDRLDAALLALAGPLLLGGLLVTSASALALSSSPLSPPAQEWVLVLEAQREALFAALAATSASALGSASGAAAVASGTARGAVAAAATSPSLVLVVGGVATLGVSIGLLALTSASAPEPVAAAKPRRRSTATTTDASVEGPASRAVLDEAFERGRRAGATAAKADLDATFDLLVENGFGAPRILRSTSTLLLVALDDCRGCRDGAAGRDGCSFERGFLEGALSVALGAATVAHEPRCRGRGDARCEFEVWHA